MSFYIDDAQRRAIQRARKTLRWRSEWPTWLLIAGIYGGWFGIAMNARALGVPVAARVARRAVVPVHVDAA